VIKAKWEPGYKVFSQEIGLKFSKKMGIFPENWVFLQKKVFTFYARLLVQRSPQVSPGYIPGPPSNPPLIKWREAYWCYFSALGVFFVPPPENFPADTLKAEQSV